jgi:stage IV sporulation protein FB
MAWQDRPYYRDSSSGAGNPLTWLLYGRVPLFTIFGIRVQAHSSLILYAALVLLFGLGTGFTWQDRVLNIGVLFVIVLLHEFGHCFAARWVGGDAEEIVMHPLGGLALARPPHRWLPTFITVAGGPAVNVLICIVCGALLWITTGRLPKNPFIFEPFGAFNSWFNVYRYAWWIFQISWMLLIFNLLPIFPLDGGQMLQSLLWPKFGYYKSMMFACITGMVGAVIGAMIALASRQIWLAVLAVMGFVTCMNMRRALVEMGPEEYEDSIDYSAAYDINAGRPAKKKKSRWFAGRAAKRARKIAAHERAERQKIDDILAKLSAHGMNSLSWSEKRTLKRATERQRQRDAELSEIIKK